MINERTDLTEMMTNKKPNLPPNMEMVNDMSREDLRKEFELVKEKKSKLSALQRDLVIFRFQFEELGMYREYEDNE